MIVFTAHAKDKLRKEFGKLGIAEKTARQVIHNPDEILYDALSNRFVAISWSHNLAVIHEKTDDNYTVITVIYSSELKNTVTRRRRTGRWI